MNILLLTHQGDLAGSTHSIAYLAKGLAARGHKVYAGIRKESLLFDLLEDTGVIRVPMTFTGRFDMDNVYQIKQIVKSEKIQTLEHQAFCLPCWEVLSFQVTFGFAKMPT